MNYMGDSVWWNKRFKDRGQDLMMHEKCLEEDISFFHAKKTILDIACGDGRNAIYLARLGFKVHAVDFSTEAIKRLHYFADRDGQNIKTDLIDLSKDGITNIKDTYDVIIMNHYKFPVELYSNLSTHLNIEGILWVNGFREVPWDNPNVKESDIIYENDFEALKRCKLINKKEYEWNKRKFVRYIWKAL